MPILKEKTGPEKRKKKGGERPKICVVRNEYLNLASGAEGSADQKTARITAKRRYLILAKR